MHSHYKKLLDSWRKKLSTEKKGEDKILYHPKRREHIHKSREQERNSSKTRYHLAEI